MLLEELFNQTVEYLSKQNVFYGHGVEMAEDEVVLVLMFVLGVDFETLNQLGHQKVNSTQIKTIENLLEQRVENKIPMAYLVGFSVFAGLKFKIDSRALIPRSPFVELIDQGFEPWIDISQPTRVLDLCTGSGCIGLAIAHYFSQTMVDLADLSKEALDLAKENQIDLNLESRSQLIQSDIFENITQTYDLIVTNPPYVADDEYQELPKEYSHEPKMALVSELNGMEIPVRILLEASNYLNENGYIFLEVGYNDHVLDKILPNVEFQWLEFSLGGQGICVFTRGDLLKYRSEFENYLKQHVA